MLNNWFDYTLLTLFNATVCIFLPRLLTLNWSALVSKRFAQKSESEIQSEVVGESIPQS